ncbi:hypothetical protein SXCC_02830 [Gluconacetobacter sp. SXCC-1]|nr:hypothetical protein SXCC_02830 [Gluconacetobacter sp. SXCC-1]
MPGYACGKKSAPYQTGSVTILHRSGMKSTCSAEHLDRREDRPFSDPARQ